MVSRDLNLDMPDLWPSPTQHSTTDAVVPIRYMFYIVIEGLSEKLPQGNETFVHLSQVCNQCSCCIGTGKLDKIGPQVKQDTILNEDINDLFMYPNVPGPKCFSNYMGRLGRLKNLIGEHIHITRLTLEEGLAKQLPYCSMNCMRCSCLG